jgi:hypothetical protein
MTTYVRAHQDSQYLLGDDGLVHRAKLVCATGGQTYCNLDYVFRCDCARSSCLHLVKQTRKPITCFGCVGPTRW